MITSLKEYYKANDKRTKLLKTYEQLILLSYYLDISFEDLFKELSTINELVKKEADEFGKVVAHE